MPAFGWDPGDAEPSGAHNLMWSDVGVQGDTGVHSLMEEIDANGLLRKEASEGNG